MKDDVRGAVIHAHGESTRSPRAAVQRRSSSRVRRPTVDDLECSLGAPALQLDAFDGAIQCVWDALAQKRSDDRRALRERARAPHEAARAGTAGPSGTLPHMEQIQRSFGPDHDLSSVQAHVGGSAAEACDDLQAHAYASGTHVAFAQAPSLELAAHEATHVVQQRSGRVQLSGGVGEVR